MTEASTDEMAKRYRAGESLQEIGDEYGISRQAVQRRLARAGVRRRDSTKAGERRYRAWCKDPAPIEAAIRAHQGLRPVAVELDVPLRWVERFSRERFGALPPQTQRQPLRFDDEAIRSALLQVAERTNGAGLSLKLYDEHRNTEHPSSVTVVGHMGSWSAACAAAGLPVERTTRVYETKWPRPVVLEVVRKYVRSCRRAKLAPSAHDYEHRWRTDHEGPSLNTIRKVFGSWRSALWAATLG